jgi:hypothetical protein
MSSNVLALVDRFADEVREAQKRNYERWPILGHKIYPTHFVGRTYEEEVQWLKDWIKGRLAWIDSQDFPKPTIQISLKREGVEALHAEPERSGVSVERREFPESSSALYRDAATPPSVQATMSCQVGKIYYTLDGSDPRLPGGNISTNAIEYTAPVSIPKQTRLIARVRSEYALWSAPAVVNGN